MSPITETNVINPLVELSKHGQSIWFDYIRRSLITSGELKRLIDEDGLKGVTSNPAIFEKAITGSNDYAEALDELRRQQDLTVMQVYESLAIRDIQDAAEVLRPIYEETNRRDGYVSLEVSPFLANDTEGTIAEARRLWQAVSRPNVMIKVPGTPAGLPAIEQLISEGININVTLLFSCDVYEKVASAYIAGLKKRSAAGGDVSHVASVASFFVSRIDAVVDGKLEALRSDEADGLMGKVAIANAKVAYQRYHGIFGEDGWRALAANGAQTQRLLWASTGTKNPAYKDVLYIDELIGADTVNTVPPTTLDAFRDHGTPGSTLEADADGAHATLASLEGLGISLDEVTDELVTKGVALFSEAFNKLLNAVDSRCRLATGIRVSRPAYSLGADLDTEVASMLEDWRVNGKVRRLWARDATLWSRTDESKWLGWLGITEDQLAHSQRFTELIEEVKREGFTHVLLLGMGGSSLCPEVFAVTFGQLDGFPQLHVLDSTDPAQVKAVEAKVDLAKTLFIVSSKSGSTLEPNIFKQYFFERVKEVVGADQAGSRFIAVTDPGSKLEQVAKQDGFRHIFHGVPAIGGRYSALSDFGMVPAAAMGIDVPAFLDRADEMAIACSACLPTEENPGVILGVVLGVLADKGRDKLTLVVSPGIHDLGAWLEQLVAESTGKQGKGLIPVDREDLGAPEVYGDDRVFVYLRLESAADPAQDAAVGALEKAGHPVVRLVVAEPNDLGQEFFRWEIATAIVGSILGINPFDQPDVEASKIATRALTDEYEQKGSLPEETPILEEGDFRLYTDSKNADDLSGSVSLAEYLRAHLTRIGEGDYFALLAYVEMNEAHEEQLQRIRHKVRDAKRVATCLGFGPRFLHSTGQAYKGGPNSGVFLQITCQDGDDLAVPGQTYTFGTVKAAQARGDFQVLAERGRRALRIHLGPDVAAGLARLEAAVDEALS